jgi:ribosomal subunit interface protein
MNKQNNSQQTQDQSGYVASDAGHPCRILYSEQQEHLFPAKMHADLSFPLEVTFRHGSTSEPVKAFIEKTVAKLIRYEDRITRCRVVVDKSGPDSYGNHRYHVHITLSVPGKSIVAKSDSQRSTGHQNVYRAIRTAFSLARRELKVYRSKRNFGKRRPRRLVATGIWQQAPREENVEDLGNEENVHGTSSSPPSATSEDAEREYG